MKAGNMKKIWRIEKEKKENVRFNTELSRAIENSDDGYSDEGRIAVHGL